jgi:hypothetical protein
MGTFYKALASPKAAYYYNPLSSEGVVRSDENMLNKIPLHKLVLSEAKFGIWRLRSICGKLLEKSFS